MTLFTVNEHCVITGGLVVDAELLVGETMDTSVVEVAELFSTVLEVTLSMDIAAPVQSAAIKATSGDIRRIFTVASDRETWQSRILLQMVGVRRHSGRNLPSGRW